jgi:hypothetical protein
MFKGKGMQMSEFELTNIIFTSALASDTSNLPEREHSQLNEV